MLRSNHDIGLAHRTTAYSRRAPSPRRSIRSKRRRGASSREVTPGPPARVGAACPPSTRLLTKTLSSSARPLRRKDQMTVLPPSTRMDRTFRAARRSSRPGKSTSFLPIRKTSAGANVRLHSSDVTISVAALPSRTWEVAGVLPSESRTTRSGFRPFAYSVFTVSFGSSLRTVPTPTRIASTDARRRCTRRRSSSLLSRTPVPSESAIFPSMLIAAFTITRGRTAIRWAGRITTLRVRSEVHLARRPARAGGSDESPSGPRRRVAIPSKGGGDPRGPLRCGRPRGPAGSEPGTRSPPLRDGLYRRRHRPDPAEAARPLHVARNRGRRRTSVGGPPGLHEDPAALQDPRKRRPGFGGQESD